MSPDELTDVQIQDYFAHLIGERKATMDVSGKIYYQGIVTEVLNPKTALFFISFSPQYQPLFSQPFIGHTSLRRHGSGKMPRSFATERCHDGLQGAIKPYRSVLCKHNLPVVPNLLNRQFEVKESFLQTICPLCPLLLDQATAEWQTTLNTPQIGYAAFGTDI